MHIEFRLNYDLYLLSILIVINMKAKCGQVLSTEIGEGSFKEKLYQENVVHVTFYKRTI